MEVDFTSVVADKFAAQAHIDTGHDFRTVDLHGIALAHDLTGHTFLRQSRVESDYLIIEISLEISHTGLTVEDHEETVVVLINPIEHRIAKILLSNCDDPFTVFIGDPFKLNLSETEPSRNETSHRILDFLTDHFDFLGLPFGREYKLNFVTGLTDRRTTIFLQGVIHDTDRSRNKRIDNIRNIRLVCS